MGQRIEQDHETLKVEDEDAVAARVEKMLLAEYNHLIRVRLLDKDGTVASTVVHLGYDVTFSSVRAVHPLIAVTYEVYTNSQAIEVVRDERPSLFPYVTTGGDIIIAKELLQEAADAFNEGLYIVKKGVIVSQPLPHISLRFCTRKPNPHRKSECIDPNNCVNYP